MAIGNNNNRVNRGNRGVGGNRVCTLTVVNISEEWRLN